MSGPSITGCGSPGSASSGASGSKDCGAANGLVQIEIRERAPLVAVAGNPNTGKTTLFNRLTGHRAKVGNYPGVTVERLEGRLQLPGVARTARIVDVPGTYSLAARGVEEQIALWSICGLGAYERPDVVVLVLDGTQLERNVYLALQVLELDLPVVLAINMVDELGRDERVLDTERLRQDLGVPVVAVSALRGAGLDELRAAVAGVLEDPASGRPGARWRPGDDVRGTVESVARNVPEQWSNGDPDRAAALALWALLSVDEDDELEGLPPELRRSALDERAAFEAVSGDFEPRVIGGRYAWIDAHADGWVRGPRDSRRSMTDRVDALLLHPVLGFTLFLALMTVVFQSLFAWADPAIGAIEGVFAHLGGWLEGVLPAGFLRDLLVEGIVAGVGGVLVFLPQILLLFLFVALMEGTGYMARVAFLMDRVMRAVGLHGRAFVPMLSGYACAIPAVMATRTMERRRDRMLTMMVVPLMTCSARLPVYGLLIAAIYPIGDENGFQQGLLMAAMYVFSTLMALACAAVLGRTLFKGVPVPPIIEMPPYRLPGPLGVLRVMWERSLVFVREAGTVILACTVGMWLLLSFPKGAEPSPELRAALEQVEADAASADGVDGAALDAERARLEALANSEALVGSYAGRLGRAIEPTIEPLGFDWKIGVGLLGAFAAREVFVSTMAVVYGLDEEAAETETLRERVRAQRRPDGTPLYTPLVCLSLMVFFALACQCMSTLAVVKRETRSYRWPVFMFSYMTALAWIASFVVFQGGQLIGLE
ncbi:Ferrous iron transport protein B [Planctomycetes bacterium Pla163]|uniref:Ferrous iron transport protein B n=1 Tax=Rohdeia mirabilis TaxID=2528008 RepID=A0A518D0U2_9BACT|nr:Ferrous iron transport protein B [Planctomycetes bacterium Pla163]